MGIGRDRLGEGSHSAMPEPDVGTTVGHYRLTELIGRGGMGSVYRAVDLRLGRTVAIKFLSSSLVADPMARRRFLREAQTASTLSHPNICTIYEVNDQDDRPYIVMEHVEGKTLKEILARGPLPVEIALGFAIDIADALEEAHRKGIIHRDIKPSNVIINERETAVVLDFGLAKQLPSFSRSEEHAEELSSVTTGAMIIGTAHYMSPEQIRGEPVDHRSDLFSLGIVLYEMLSGTPPFAGATTVDVLHAILYEEPLSLSERRPEVDIELERIVRKALRKDPRDRFQSAAEMKEALVALAQQKGMSLSRLRSLSGATRVTQVVRWDDRLRRVRWPRLGASLLGLLVVMVGVWWYRSHREEKPAFDLQSLERVSIVSWKGEQRETAFECRAKFSPDGNVIVFSSTRGGDRDIWIKQIGGGEPIQITSDPWQDLYPIWSPDGQSIAFVSDRGGQLGIWTIPALGGTPTLVKALGPAPGLIPDLKLWSAKSAAIYFEVKFNLFALSLRDREVRQITHFDPARDRVHEFSVSPNEDRIVYVAQREGQSDLWVSDLDGRNPIRITHDGAEDRNPIWHPDGQRIIYSSYRHGLFQACMVRASPSTPVQITLGEGDNLVSDVARDGSKILLYGSKEESDLWIAATDQGRESQITADVGLELWPHFSPGGETIVFQAKKDQGAGGDLTRSLIVARRLGRGGQSIEVATEGFDPHWSPDGTQIAFLRRSAEGVDIWIVPAVGGEPRQLTREGIDLGGFYVTPYNRRMGPDFAWSPESRQIAYCSSASGTSALWTVTVDGSERRQLSHPTDARQRCYAPHWSPTGRQVAYVSHHSAGESWWEVSVIDVIAGTERVVYRSQDVVRVLGWTHSELLLVIAPGQRLPPHQATDIRLARLSLARRSLTDIRRFPSAYFSNNELSPDRHRVALALREEGRDNIAVVSLNGGKVRRVTTNTDARIYFSVLCWSPDGRYLCFGKQAKWSSISMISRFR